MYEFSLRLPVWAVEINVKAFITVCTELNNRWSNQPTVRKRYTLATEDDKFAYACY
jgi:hypothetical protein